MAAGPRNNKMKASPPAKTIAGGKGIIYNNPSGDGASAALDLTNTGIDISRLDYNQQADAKKKKVDTDLPDQRGLKALSRAI